MARGGGGGCIRSCEVIHRPTRLRSSWLGGSGYAVRRPFVIVCVGDLKLNRARSAWRDCAALRRRQSEPVVCLQNSSAQTSENLNTTRLHSPLRAKSIITFFATIPVLEVWTSHLSTYLYLINQQLPTVANKKHCSHNSEKPSTVLLPTDTALQF